jgi:glycosyltransferase involved in cell wall biosynthesis
MSRRSNRSFGPPQVRAAPRANPASAPPVSPQYDLYGKRLLPANVAANLAPPLPPRRQSPRTLAGATILQIVPALREEPIAHAAVDTALTLLQAGARAIVAGDGGPLVGELRAFGGEWMPLPHGSLNPLAVRRSTKLLQDIINHERVDIIHAQDPAAAWSALAATRGQPVRLVTSFGDRLDVPGWFGKTFHAALARGERLIAPSSFIAHAMMERYKLRPERITVIPRRIDTALFSPAAVIPERVAAMRRAWGVLPNVRIVLIPGRLAPWNGQIGIIDAARLLVGNGQRNLAFVFVGDDRTEPAYRNALLHRAQVQAVDTLVRVVGVVHDMPTALAAADVVVVPALKPPLTGSAAAQAQAMGRPVVVNAVGVLPENVLTPPRMREELRTGWVVRPGHAGELARGIGAALRLDRKTYEAMGARSRQFAEFMFSPQSVAAKMRGLYTSLLARDA